MRVNNVSADLYKVEGISTTIPENSGWLREMGRKARALFAAEPNRR